MYKKIAVIFGLIVIFSLSFLFDFNKTKPHEINSRWWEVQSIDTVKYSRDVAREKLNDPSFESVIDKQVKDIAQTGATHVAIATPYDSEFYPFLKQWVDKARKYDLNVWFRGNWSGWEGWFDYERIDRAQHLRKTEEFILKNRGLFEDGDIFTPCPECENGGPGDPRHNGDLIGHRKFLIDEYKTTKKAFRRIGSDVSSNYLSMNGDVARAVMDPATTSALDGIVTIDHYVATPEKLSQDIAGIARSSGGRIVLGEFGAPIPDIHGKMSEKEQADWINEAFLKLVTMNEVEGINYWTNEGSSTKLWNDDGSKRMGADTLKSFYKADVIRGKIEDEAGRGITGVYLIIDDRRYFTDSHGKFAFPYLKPQIKAKIDAAGFISQEITTSPEQMKLIVLKKKDVNSWYKIRKSIQSFLDL